MEASFSSIPEIVVGNKVSSYQLPVLIGCLVVVGVLIYYSDNN